jgi:repressor LexA
VSQNTMDQTLTPRQMQLLNLIASTRTSRPYSATIQELASQLQISRTTAFEHLAALREKGLLQGSPNKARSLKLTPQGLKLHKKTAAASSQVAPDEQPTDCAALPLLGRVAAGRPIEAIQHSQQLSLTAQFGTTDDVFALQVTGDSMINDGINDGDYVICKRTPNAHNGAIVVAIVDDDTATVKRFYKEADSIRLQPANDKYQPIYTQNCRIEAVVVGLLRKL